MTTPFLDPAKLKKLGKVVNIIKKNPKMLILECLLFDAFYHFIIWSLTNINTLNDRCLVQLFGLLWSSRS